MAYDESSSRKVGRVPAHASVSNPNSAPKQTAESSSRRWSFASGRSDSRVTYIGGVTIGVLVALLFSTFTPLGSALSQLYLNQLGGVPLWGLNAEWAAIVLAAAVGIGWIITGLVLWRERSRKREAGLSASPPAGAI